MLPFEGDDITERISVTEDMALRAAFRISWEQPGFTMLRTFINIIKIIKKKYHIPIYKILYKRNSKVPCQDIHSVPLYGPYNPGPQYTSLQS